MNDEVFVPNQSELHHFLRDHGIQATGATIQNGIVDCNTVTFNDRHQTRIPIKFGRVQRFSCRDINLWSLENSPDIVDVTFDCSGTNITSTKYCPKRIGGSFIISDVMIEDPMEYRHILLTECEFVDTLSFRLNKILTDGRDNGVMPSELIPGKIRQLKEMPRFSL